ncbi:MAG: galactose mutarotase [Methylobacteriaceae bacterium]|nr:galactose mutarotase [Methylobacteriaceae bacterium]MBV9247306.1 galactose mutarotase [Methylobacteriaceae bacterium]
MTMHQFGEVDGHAIFEVALKSAAGAEARVITWGAVLRELVIPARTGPRQVVLGFENIADYLSHSPYFGATVGRFANRISRGHFVIDGREYSLELNEGRNSLHGGRAGFGRRPWKLGAYDASSVTMTLQSPDGDGGYPGNLDVTCTYRLLEPATVQIEMTGTSDMPTVINLAHHSYFNLDGTNDVRDHELTLHAAFYTPVDDELIPTGEIRSVAGTPYDFRAPRRIRPESGGKPDEVRRYDTNFIISRMPDAATGLAHAATLCAPLRSLLMEMHTTEPAVQFYDGGHVNCPVPGLGGALYGPHAGLCLEAQVYPDSPNRRHFSPCVLRPDEIYRQVTEYRFGQ